MGTRRLRPEEHELLRGIRLRALREAPSAYGSTYERESAFTDDIWRQRLHPDGNPHFVYESPDGAPAGIAVGGRHEIDAHVAELLGMWVEPVARGTNAADALIARVVGWAAHEDLAAVRLHVMDGNGRAERVYERNGFRRTGTTFVRERDGMLEIEMERGV